MSEHDVRPGGALESGSGELPGQENDEGPGGGPPGMGDDDHGTLALDELPEPEGDPVEPDDLIEAQEEADALRLEWVRAELDTFAEPEGSPYDVEDDTADDNADADDYDEAEADDYGAADADDYADSAEYEDDAGDGSDGDGGDGESGYDSAGDGE